MKRVALVDDNDDNRARIAAILEDAKGFELREYGDGRSALEGMTHARPDLVLLDVSLPGGLSGPELLAQLRRRDDLQALPVVLLSAAALPGDRERARSLGFDAHLGKPIVEEELLSTIRRLLG